MPIQKLTRINQVDKSKCCNSSLFYYYLLCIITPLLFSCQMDQINAQTITAQKSEFKKNIINNNKHLAFDNDLILSEKEKILAKKLSVVRANLAYHLQSKNFSFYQYPFHSVKPIIDSSFLLRIIKKMPKGGLLHCHSMGLANIEWLINKASKMPECYVFVERENDKLLYGTLAIFKEGLVPPGFMKLSEKMADDQNFNVELNELLVLKRRSFSDGIDPWSEFENRFDRIRQLLNYRPFFKEYYHKALLDLVLDNVQHVEIRMIFDHLFDFEVPRYPYEMMIVDFIKIFDDIKQIHPQFTLKLIYTSLKFLSVEEAKKQIQQAITFKSLYPNLISGFDLVAEEDKGNSIAFYDQVWNDIDELSTKLGVELPLFLHAGESKSTHNTNVNDLLLLNNKRIGHGLNLVLFPFSMQVVKDKDMLVELSPLSNQILGFVNDLRNHPGRILLNNGIQCSINNDDPAVFGYDGLSYDFWSVYTAWELDFRALKKLVFNSINYSSLSKAQKEEALKHLNLAWEKFVIEANQLIDNQYNSG